jgi:dihydropteroate synthase
MAEQVRLGERVFDVRWRALVMGIVNRTPDSFWDKGRFFDLSASLERTEALVEAGADIIDVGGVKAGPGPEVSEAEEMDRVLPVVERIVASFDVAVSVDTWRASVADEAFRLGAVLGNDISGLADPRYAEVAARAGAGVVVTHIRLAPRVRDPEPVYGDLVGDVCRFLTDRAARAVRAGVRPESVIVDAGLDLGKTTPQSLALLGASDRLAGLGYTLLLSASNKGFLGEALGLGIDERGDASLAAGAIALSLGARVVRVHDVERTRQLVSTLAALLESRSTLVS